MVRRRPPRNRGAVTAVYRVHWAFWLLFAFLVAAGVLAVSEVGERAGITPGMGVFVLIVCWGFALWVLWLLGHRVVLWTEGIEKVSPFGRRFAAWEDVRGIKDVGFLHIPHEDGTAEGGELSFSRWTLWGRGGRKLMTWSKDQVADDIELAHAIRHEIAKGRARRVRAERESRRFEPPPRRRRTARAAKAKSDPRAVGTGNLPEAPVPGARKGHRSMTAKVGWILGVLLGVFVVVAIVWREWADLKESTKEQDARWDSKRAREHTRDMLVRLHLFLIEQRIQGSERDPRIEALRALPTIHPHLTEGGFVDNGVNTPIEVLHRCYVPVEIPGRSAVQMRTGDTDGDGQPEFVDEAGCPLVFLPRRVSGQKDEECPVYRRANGRDFRPTPGFVYHHAARIFALGPDRRPFTEDDLLPPR